MKCNNRLNNLVFSQKNLKRKFSAFTLAEVMMVLVILGVVAAISISSMVKHYSRLETVVKVRKTYALLTNAYKEYQVINRRILGLQAYTQQGATNVANAFVPYINISRDVGTNPTEKAKVMNRGDYHNLDGKGGYNIYVDASTNGWKYKYYLIILRDGGQIWFKGHESNDGIHAEIFYDVNGKKGPNTRGRDFFEFYVMGKDIVPTGAINNSASFANTCSKKDDPGWGCAAWIVRNGNMDYLDCEGLRLGIDTKCP